MTGNLQNILPEKVPEAESEIECLADTIRDTFPPEFLYHPDVLSGPTTLYHVISGVLSSFLDHSIRFASPVYLLVFRSGSLGRCTRMKTLVSVGNG
jgi:hypothetical protein